MGDINSIKKYAIEGSADGFMWGAIVGAVSVGYGGGAKAFNKGIRELKSINSHLAGKKHPVTGVFYRLEYIKDKTGKWVKGVFPKFDSVVAVKLSAKAIAKKKDTGIWKKLQGYLKIR